MKMKMPEFIEKYCKDIDTSQSFSEKTKVRRRHDLVQEYGLQYAGYDINDDNSRIYYIEHNGKKIDVLDFIEFEKETFIDLYEKVDTREALGDLYDRYVSTVDITSGADAISEIKSQLAKAKESVEKWKSFRIKL